MSGRGALRLAAVGVDGCRAGWVAVRGYEDAGGALVRTEPELLRAQDGGLRALVAACEAMRPPPSVGVDVPMGLPRRAGLRACDRAARDRLGPRRACVFPAPDRELLAAVAPDGELRLGAWAAPRRDAALDDLLDAYAALWSARRHAAGGADVLGDGERDERGLLMQMVT